MCEYLLKLTNFYVPANASASSSSVIQSGLSKHAAKRVETFQTPLSNSPKRPRLNSPMQQQTVHQQSQPLSLVTSISQQPKDTLSFSNLTSYERNWEDRAIVVPAANLKDVILNYDDKNEEQLIDQVLCGVAKQLRDQGNKPDSRLIFTLLYLVKIRPLFFCTSVVVEAFSSLMKKESLSQFKSKNNNIVPVMVINLFFHAFHDENVWPIEFIKMFVDDSLGDRVWVDNEECKDFVDIIVHSFHTKLPVKSMLQASDISSFSKLSDSSSNPATSVVSPAVVGGEDSMGDGEASGSSFPSSFSDQSKEAPPEMIVSRYEENEQEVIDFLAATIAEQLNRRPLPGTDGVSRNMIKLLMATAGLRNVRVLVAQKLDTWFQSSKLSRLAQDLMLTVFINCTEFDEETIGYLVKMKLKNKTIISQFNQCFREMLKQNKPGTFDLTLQTVLRNELSQIRVLNNLHLISIMFQHSPDRAVLVLVQFFLQMIFTTDDFLRALQFLLREIFKSVRPDHMNFVKLVWIMLDESRQFSEKIEFAGIDVAIKERTVHSIIDLITLTIHLSVSANVRDAFNNSGQHFNKPDRKEIIRNFQLQISDIQRMTVKWLEEVVIRRFTTNRAVFHHALNKILFNEPQDSYFKIDSLTENERNNVFRYTSDIPLQEQTVLSILQMGSNRDIPIACHDSLEFVKTLVHRAACIYDGDLNTPVLLFQDINIIQKLFDNSRFVAPENIVFPVNYQPPRFAVVEYYWNVWNTVVVIAAHLPYTFGKYAWDNFPTFRVLVEMIVTNNYQFPVKTNSEELINQDQQIGQIEKYKIIEFESYLAGNQEINETNSYLLSKLITLDPFSPARRPIVACLENFRLISQHLRLCHLLCQSRQPDFLSMIIKQQQQFSNGQVVLAPMTWLVELVESNENNFGMLPVQCLCEFLLSQIAEEIFGRESDSSLLNVTNKNIRLKRKEKRRKQIRLISHFQSSPEILGELIKHLVCRLSSPKQNTRVLAHKALYLISTTNTDEYLTAFREIDTHPNSNLHIPPLVFQGERGWLRTNLFPLLNSTLLEQVYNELIESLKMETDPSFICEYFDFISSFPNCMSDSKLVLSCCNLFTNRYKMINHILLYWNSDSIGLKFLSSLYKLFANYMQGLLVQPKDTTKAWPNEYIRFTSLSSPSPTIPIHMDIVRGIILSLSYSHMVPEDEVIFLKKLFFNKPYPQIYKNQEQHALISEQNAFLLIGSKSGDILDFVLGNVENDVLVKLASHSGLPDIAAQKILQTLDSKSSKLKSVVIDNKQYLLDVLKIHWSQINHGFKFAKACLGYDKSISEENEAQDQSSRKTLSNLRKDKDNDETERSELFKSVLVEIKDNFSKSKKNTTKFLEKMIQLIETSGLQKTRKYELLLKTIILNLINKSNKANTFQDFFDVIRKTLKRVVDEKRFSINLVDCPLWKMLSMYFDSIKNAGKSVVKTNKSCHQETQSKVMAPYNSTSDLKKVLSEIEHSINEDEGDTKVANIKWNEVFINMIIEKFHSENLGILMPLSRNVGNSDTTALQSIIFSHNRSYLFTLLLYNSNFSTLKHCIKFVLQTKKQPKNKKKPISQLNATGVLDFVTLCLNSPKLWIGRTNDTMKTLKNQDILKLTYRQIKHLIDFVLTESKISTRIDLILKGCCANRLKTLFVAELLRRYSDPGSRELMAR